MNTFLIHSPMTGISPPTEKKNTLLLGLEGHEDTYEFFLYSTGDLNNHAFLALWQHQHKASTILSLSSREDHHSQFGNAFTYQGGLHHTLSENGYTGICLIRNRF